MSYKLESDVIKALGELLENKFNCDVIIHVGEKPNFKEYHAHSNILSCRSKYFNEILSTEDIKKKDGKYIITKQNITPQAFDVILKYLYTGHININNKTGTELLDIMIASDELKLEQLTKLTEEFIVKNYQQFLQNDPVGIIQIVYYNKSFFNLQEFCLETICSEPKILFNNNKFINLPAPLLEIILKRDDLNLTEIEIWDNLIKWGVSRDDRRNTKTAKVGYSNGTLSVSGAVNHGPIFGGSFYFDNDGNTWIASNNNHSNIDGFPSGSIKVDNYEVFQVVK
ncbi:unnamed protein product [Rhizophagus irregularis]|nr:unnamed protein product [Rhizophagus irregularis]